MEEAWQRWWQMAQGSFVAAQTLERTGEARSSASRAYYAAYQAATALLLYAKQSPPEGREAWSHEATPGLLGSMPRTLLTPTRQRDMGNRLSDLYDLRLIADYRGEEDVETAALRAAIRSAAFILKTIGNVLPG